MLTKDDLNTIIGVLDRVKKYHENIDRLLEISKLKINTLTLNNVIEGGVRICAEDSGYVTGIVGPISYVYVKSFAISNRGEKVGKREFFVSNSSFFGDFNISDIGELLAKYIEYLNIYDMVTDESSIYLMDGSLIADTILALSFAERFGVVNEDIDEFSLPNGILKESEIKTVARSLLNIIRRFLEKIKETGSIVLYFVKRPVDSRKLVEMLIGGENNINDFSLLSTYFRDSEFITDFFNIEWMTTNQRRVFGKVSDGVLMSYYRLLSKGHIYRIEIPKFEDLDKNRIIDVVSYILKRESSSEGYPKLLYLAHKMSKVSNRDKSIIEEIVIKNLPKGFASKEITRW